MYCQVCGMPHGISRGNVWHEDGTISGRFPPYIKGTFFDVDEIGYLFRYLSEYMEYDIGDIVAGGKYHDTVEYMTAMIERLGEASGGELPPPEALYRAMLYPARIWGIAEAEFSSVENGSMTVSVKDPYSIPLLCGDVAGVAGVVTGRAHQASWEGDGREGTITIFPGEAFSRLSRRIDEKSDYGEKPAAGELDCERCAECGVPASAGHLFAWDREGCRIRERSSGRRYCFNNTRGIGAVLSLLADELGEDVEIEMTDIAREYARTLYKGLADAREELETFPYRGWGRVTGTSAPGGRLEVGVVSPYNHILLAGRIWGMGEALSGSSLRVQENRVEGNVLRLSFGPG